MGTMAIAGGLGCCKPLLLPTRCEKIGSSRTVRVGVFPVTSCLRIGCGRRRIGEAWSLRGVGTEELLRRGVPTQRRRAIAVRMMWGKVDVPKPTVVPLEPITGDEHLTQVLSEAQERNQPIIIDWSAAWCRKCIYLKPKLEKLAAEYHPDIKFYYVDVNVVPQSVVKRASVTKMPTIQLWKDGGWRAEVIGGHQAWLVMDEVREMIGARERE